MPLRSPWRFLLAVALAGLLFPGTTWPRAPTPPLPDTLLRQRLKALLAEVQSAVTAADSENALAGLGKLGSADRLGPLLADLYLDASAQEKAAVLLALRNVGVEYARKALPRIAADFAVTQSTHPNPLSFTGFFVLEKFRHLAWKELPTRKSADEKDPPRDVLLPSRRVSPGGWVHTGELLDRQAMRQIVLSCNLHTGSAKRKAYTVPPAEDTDWIRVLDQHAFVRLRGASCGVDFLFVRSGKGWTYLASLGHWVN